MTAPYKSKTGAVIHVGCCKQSDFKDLFIKSPSFENTDVANVFNVYEKTQFSFACTLFEQITDSFLSWLQPIFSFGFGIEPEPKRWLWSYTKIWISGKKFFLL